MHKNYKQSVNRIQTQDLQDLRRRKIVMKESLMQLRTIIYSKCQCLEEESTEIRTRNAVSIHNIVYSVSFANGINLVQEQNAENMSTILNEFFF